MSIKPRKKRAERQIIQKKRKNQRRGPAMACFPAKKPQKIRTKKTLDMRTAQMHW